MKFRRLVWLEQAINKARDNFVIEPLARSRLVQRHAHYAYNYAIKVLDDHRIVFDPRDREIGARLFRHGDWYRNEFRMVLARLAAAGRNTCDKVFLDVGANIGTQTVYALVGGDFARSVAIEPMPGNLDMLEMNVALNKLGDRVSIVRSAAGERTEQLTMTLNPRNNGGHSLHSGFVHDPGASVEVDVAPVDEMLSRLQIAPTDVGLFWLDVEGFEPQAIAGARSLIEAKIPLFVEFNAKTYGPTATAELLKRLAACYGSAYSPGNELRPPREFAVDAIDPAYLQGDLLFM
jgi:FkbM family methyltransferase